MIMITKSIYERSVLDAYFYNAKKDKKYIDKYCPDDAKERFTNRLKKYAELYFVLRRKFDNYSDSKTLKADKFFNGIKEGL